MKNESNIKNMENNPKVKVGLLDIDNYNVETFVEELLKEQEKEYWRNYHSDN